ncbi:MAG: hypothetical protein C0412_14795 [Flavobacterium sp.]|nr:hypothetical protein [Flavobacterium sp.]
MNNWYFASGDLDFFWNEQIQLLSWLPVVYRTDLGFGWPSIISLWLDYPFRLTVKILSLVGLSWFIIEKILWVLVFTLAIYSSYRLAHYILKLPLLSGLASLLYIGNTYFLLLFSGGQLGVALAYAFAPFVLYRFIRVPDKKKRVKWIIGNGLWFSLLITFDLRLAYLIGIVIFLYKLIFNRSGILQATFSFIVTCGTQLFWILPIVLTKTGPSVMGQDFINPGMLHFLSFADFSHTLSLLHPNWPENLFGKVYFLQPEFLLLPLMAFTGLVFLKRKYKEHENILFMSMLALFGAFFAKGMNAPFGQIFQWFFQNVPGFVFFRDPTKFYLYIAIGYSILIPFSLNQISKRLKKYQWGVYAIFIIFLLFTLRSVFAGNVRGNIRPLELPIEYIKLKDILIKDTIPSRTFWIPGKDSFAYYSATHPLINLSTLFHNISISETYEIATSSAFISNLTEAGVKYVVVPLDVEKKLFLTDYQFNSQTRDMVIAALQKTSLKQRSDFQELIVFENPEFKTMEISIPLNVEVQTRYATIGVIFSLVCILLIIACNIWA